MALLVIIIDTDGDTIKNNFLFLFQTMPSIMEKPDIETVRAVVHKILVMYPDGVTREELLSKVLYLSRIMRKPTFCICENKDADQLRGNREADQRLCFRYIDSTNPLLSKSEISSL